MRRRLPKGRVPCLSGSKGRDSGFPFPQEKSPEVIIAQIRPDSYVRSGKIRHVPPKIFIRFETAVTILLLQAAKEMPL